MSVNPYKFLILNKKNMKKLLYTFGIFIFSVAAVMAQTFTIGTGTTNNLYGPIYIYSNGSTNTHSWNLSIYTQTELSASGAGTGTISSIGWYKNDAGGYLGNDATFEIYIKPTTLSDFSGGAGNFDLESVGATLVYNSSTVGLPASIGWVDFALNTPYFWNGSDNLMILTRWVRQGAGTAGVNWASTGGFIPAVVSHSFSASATMGSLYTTANRANIHFDLTPLSVNELDASASLQVYPNPTKSQLNVGIQATSIKANLVIMNAYGQEVYSENINQINNQINLSDFAPGLYTLQVKTANSVAIRKFIKTE